MKTKHVLTLNASMLAYVTTLQAAIQIRKDEIAQLEAHIAAVQAIAEPDEEPMSLRTEEDAAKTRERLDRENGGKPPTLPQTNAEGRAVMPIRAAG